MRLKKYIEEEISTSDVAKNTAKSSAFIRRQEKEERKKKMKNKKRLGRIPIHRPGGPMKVKTKYNRKDKSWKDE